MATTHYGFTTVNGSDTVDVQKAINTPLQQVDSTIYTETNEPMIVIGDSWAAGYTPSGTVKSWSQYVEDNFNVVGHSYIGGSGFIAGTTFSSQLTTIANSLTQNVKDSVKKIVIGGCLNDIGQSADPISSAVKSFATTAKTLFKNAKILLFFMGIATNVEQRGYNAASHYENALAYFSSACNDNDIAFVNACPLLYKTSLFSTDGFHPTAAAHVILGNNICSVLRGINTSTYIPWTTIQFNPVAGTQDLQICFYKPDVSINATKNIPAYIRHSIRPTGLPSRTYNSTFFAPETRPRLSSNEYFPFLVMNSVSYQTTACIHFSTGYYTLPILLNCELYTDNANIRTMTVQVYGKIANNEHNNYMTATFDQIQFV